ncbi:MAG: hypothetical protein QT03_C0001G0262 [archaeon GW2011_AR10]|uniref:Type II toxin-antitoxin system HicB family antitoxin n=1 Tax=Candidatus Iainarchaeum sp. TaxID=3101447 RepID=A0A7J4IST6_9ARCH|nr:MAG: hypothetical protein QT03_C0001G0262 [archaeon GW2011_AR10]HIH08532.1 type II toxin-antitoxin system HicB family antitoxin [Candidatus Diapherotrites archaeon]
MVKSKKEIVLNYTAVFEPQPEGGYTVIVPALAGCVSEGNSLEEAREMIGDAIRAYCESLLKDNLPLPKDIQLKPRNEKIRVLLSA